MYKLIKIGIIYLISLVITGCQDNTGMNCSTFMLKSEDALFVGHNLDEDPELHVPGLVCINKRGIYREGITWYELIADPEDFEQVTIPFDEKTEPKISWIAKYGSVTLNSEGIDFPDGGINEKGLAIFEMSMGYTQFKIDTTKPTLFITLWIQYQLDNYATVDEVIENIESINQQGWAWHYFVSDKQGKFAIIEYIKGEIVVHKDEGAPYPILCNSPYKKEIDRLSDYDGFTGEIRSFLFSTPRFVKAKEMLAEFENSNYNNADEFAFKILDEIKIDGWNKWGILVDVQKMIVYFHTNRNRNIKYFAFSDFNFSKNTTSEILNIHDTDFSENVAAYFLDYTYEGNYSLTKERAEGLFEERFAGLIDNGVTAEVYARRFADYSKRIREKSQ